MAGNLPEFPKQLWHHKLGTKLVKDKNEESDALINGWSKTYIKQKYPKLVYGATGSTKAVNSDAELQQAVAEGWSEKVIVADNAAAIPVGSSYADTGDLEERVAALEDNLEALSIAFRKAMAKSDEAGEDAPAKRSTKTKE